MPRKTYPKRDPDRRPTHPGAVLREIVLPELRVTKSAIAAALKISRNQLHLILSEKQPVTPETAVKLEAAFGGSARMWVNMQAAYDLWHAQRTVDVSNIPPMRAA
jgi:addiction module HigA family antidote